MRYGFNVPLISAYWLLPRALFVFCEFTSDWKANPPLLTPLTFVIYCEGVVAKFCGEAAISLRFMRLDTLWLDLIMDFKLLII